MNRAIAFLQLIRFPNLVMIGLCQWIVAHVFVESYSFALLCQVILATILIATSGYIVNDIKDEQIDVLNKGKSNIQYFSSKFVKPLFYTTSVLGVGIGFCIAYEVTWSLLFYFLGAWTVLYTYAFFFSRFKIVGNVLISALLVFVILVTFQTLTNEPLNSSLLLYAAFAFYFNWIREIVKDIEDIEGDRFANRHTWATILGQNRAKWIVMSLIFLLVPINYYIFSITTSFIILVGLSGMIFCLLIGLFLAKTKNHFHKLSFLIKILMLIGVLAPLFL